MQALFESNLAWAEGVARSVRRGLPPSFDVEDLEQAARIELWRQVQRYDAGGPARFTKRFLSGILIPDRRPSRHESAAAQNENAAGPKPSGARRTILGKVRL